MQLFGFFKKCNCKNENLFKTVVEATRSSLDINKTKKTIIDVIGKALNADRCFIMEYDKIKDTFLIVRDEYVSSDDIPKYAGADVNEDVPNFTEEFKKGNYLIVDNKKIFINNEPQEYKTEKDTIEKVQVNSAYGFPLFYDNELQGALAIHYLTREHTVSQDEIALLLSISEQIAIAIYHAKLYKQIIVQAKRESLIKNIIEKIRSSLDIDETLSFICEETAKLFNVQRVAITTVPDIENLDNFMIKKEYKLNPEIKGISSFADVHKVFYYWADKLIKDNQIIAIDNIEISYAPDYFKISYQNAGVKSLIGAPVRKGNEIWGILVLSEYNEYRQWSEEDKNLLSTIANQTFIAINQAELFESKKKAFEREKLLRQIIETARSTFNLNDVKQKIITAIAETLTANRCYIAEFNQESGKYLPISQEYLTSTSNKSVIGYDVEKNMPELVDFIKLKPLVLIPDVDKFVKENNFPDIIKNYFENYDVKSRVYVEISYKEIFFGTLVVNFPETRESFKDEDISFITTLTNQMGIVFYQSRIYDSLKLLIANQKAILNNMPFIAWLKNTDLLYEAANEPFAELCHCTIEEIIGKDDYELFPKNMAETYQREDKIVMEKRITLPIEEIIKMNEVNAWYEVFKSPVIDDKGNVIGTAGLARDISERKQAEAELLLRQEKIVKANEREILLREISSTISSTLDINEIIHTFVFEIGKIIKAQKVFFSFYEESSNTFLTPIEYFEYREFPETLKYSDMGRILDDNFPAFCEYIKTSKKIMMIPDVQKFLQDKGLENSIDTESIRKYNFNSAIAFPVVSQDKLIGFYGIEYTNATDLTQENIDFLKTLSRQTFIAMNQAELYKTTRQQAESEALLRTLTEKIRSSLDIEKILDFVCEETANVFNVQRVAVSEFSNINGSEKIIFGKEYKQNKSILGHFDIENYSEICTWAYSNLRGISSLAVDNINDAEVPDYLKNSFIKLGIKSIIGASIKKDENTWGIIFLSEYNDYRHWSEDEITLLETISNQLYIAISQSKVYEKEKNRAEKEKILRKIMEITRSTLDIKETKTNICKEIGRLYNADKCFIREYDKKQNKFKIVDSETEYLSSPDEKSLVSVDPGELGFEDVRNIFSKSEITIIPDTQKISNYNEVQNISLINYFQRFNIKSNYGIPIYSPTNDFMGKVVLIYTKKMFEIDKEGIDLFKMLAQQAGMALYQAQLYSTTKMQVETEKFNRKILEILRNELDKETIKHLFVMNVGQYFNADRVFFADYDAQSNMYLPININAEYLSSTKEKSFVGIDWSDNSMSEYIQPLLEKRELKIPCLVEYLQSNPKSQAFIQRFEDAKVKSSYNLPVLREGNLMGYFCIEFTQHDCKKLSDEDIRRIRSMCSQMGIALYQANLVVNAQDTTKVKDLSIKNIANSASEISNNIVELSEVMSKTETNCEKQIEQLNHINENVRLLLDLTNNLVESANMD